jgi:hypothetical protein
MTSGSALPLFFHRVAGVDPALHGDLRLDRTVGFGFAAGADFVPLSIGELETAAQHYPILFTPGPDPAPVALLGLRKGENLFVLPDGSWRPGSYVPLYCRAFPFIFFHAEAGETTYVGMEVGAACLTRSTGEPLFTAGRPTPTLEQSIALCDEFRAGALAVHEFARALAGLGLLDQESADINFSGGGSLRVRDFQILSQMRLRDVADDVFLDWRHRGWVSSIYAHLYSMGRWGRLIELAASTPGT